MCVEWFLVGLLYHAGRQHVEKVEYVARSQRDLASREALEARSEHARQLEVLPSLTKPACWLQETPGKSSRAVN